MTTVEEAVWRGITRLDKLADRFERHHRDLTAAARAGDDVSDELLASVGEVVRVARAEADRLADAVKVPESE